MIIMSEPNILAKEGVVHRGVVQELVPNGVFILLSDKRRYFLHSSEIQDESKKSANNNNTLRLGERIHVKFIRQRGTWELSMRSIDQVHGWDYNPRLRKRPTEVHMPEIFSIHKGIIMRIEPFGCFVESIDGWVGLLHISQMMNYKINKVEDVCKLRDTIWVKVLTVDGRKINLSRKYVNQETGHDLDSKHILWNQEQQDRHKKHGHSIPIQDMHQDDESYGSEEEEEFKISHNQHLVVGARGKEIDAFFAEVHELKKQRRREKKHKKKHKKRKKTA